MAQLPPSAVFGSTRPGQAVHVLLLIENSLPMMDHWEDLQHHILPGILGAIRIANPGRNVSHKSMFSSAFTSSCHDAQKLVFYT